MCGAVCHCVFVCPTHRASWRTEGAGTVARVKPTNQPTSHLPQLNGRRLNDETELRHLDRLLFGSNLLFLYINPLAPQLTSKGTPADVDWDFAMDEIARFEGFDTNTSGLTLEQLRTRDQVLELLPMISEANAISEEMLKKRKFEVALLSPLFMGRPRGSPTEVQVLVTNEHNKNTSFWGRGKFMDKRYQFQDMYQVVVLAGKTTHGLMSLRLQLPDGSSHTTA
eukprot:m.267855 g.267855  ORF g.267855 m.267855 type:complete len:224 (+) comp19290_c0_seq4:23-694(+)